MEGGKTDALKEQFFAGRSCRDVLQHDHCPALWQTQAQDCVIMSPSWIIMKSHFRGQDAENCVYAVTA